MFDSRGEVVGWVLAVIVIAVMGVIAFTGPYHKISKVSATTFQPMQVQIKTDPTIVGRYVPSTVTVHVGQQVRFVNISNIAHTVSDQSNQFNSMAINVGGAWTYTPSKPGTYHYYCVYHPGMHGTLIVQ